MLNVLDHQQLIHVFEEVAYWRNPESKAGFKAYKYGWNSDEARNERFKVISQDAVSHGQFHDLIERLERAK